MAASKQQTLGKVIKQINLGMTNLKRIGDGKIDRPRVRYRITIY